MAKKLLFELLDYDKKVVSTKSYSSLRDIQKDYPEYTYHALRQIYLQSTGLEPRRMHQTNQFLYSQFRIRDSPTIFKRIRNDQQVEVAV
jgi:hypothetical protein